MKLPQLPVILAFIAVLWCVAGVFVHGWAMLAYPLMWGAIGLLFLVLNAGYNAMHPTDAQPQAKRASAAPVTGAARAGEKGSRQTVG